MNNPDSKKPTYYVYGFWNIYKNKPLVVNDNTPVIEEFNKLDDALSFIQKKVVQNINITWCITSNYRSIGGTVDNYDK